MSATIIRMMARAGYNYSPADREEQARADLRQRNRPWVQPTRSAIRDNIRKNVILHLALLALPENAWRRDALEIGLGRAMERYRLALSSYQLEKRPNLPGGQRTFYREAAE